MENTINKYDRMYGGLIDISLFTKPSTIKNVQTLTGRSETFVVQTCRHDDFGDHIFIECMDENGVTRIALPPKVCNVLRSQDRSLTTQRRRNAGRRAMRNRMAAGEVINFKKKKS